ncbi:Endoribonuclease L-PSP/chorismate mutase-like protein [Fusarium flagelliforme]|nr:Endoribonuclease L-PSP/chorismate mutase-like protein [Fusarium flagelliforme]KAH7198737.1 Endoribonuclease L-PSP/chorismate mutase-like protein [Fusarium flagelliforme]
MRQASKGLLCVSCCAVHKRRGSSRASISTNQVYQFVNQHILSLPTQIVTMSHLTYYNYEGVGKTNNKEYSYSQAVRVGNTIKCSGQGGWDDQGNIDKDDLKGQIDLAFKNVEKNLKDAGARGWADVHSVRSYHISLSGSFDLMVEAFRKWMPDHQPTWTCVGVTELGIPGMIVEIEVEANIAQ